MLTIVMSLFLSSVSSSSVTPAGHRKQFDATRPTVTYRGPKSVKARNWWNERPKTQLFAADETCEFQVISKGGL